MKRKNSADYTVERVYNFILNCGGIASGSVIAKYNNISENWAQQCAREAIRRHNDIESVFGVGYRRKGVEYSYSITANLYSAEKNDYIYHWDGPKFKRMSSLDKAKECWDGWWPPEEDIKKQIKAWKKEHAGGALEIEIGLWDGKGNEVEIYYESAEWHE